MASSATIPPTTTDTPTPSSTTIDLTASCTTAVPGKYGNVPIDACNSYYNFDPQFEPAVAVAALFGFLLATHIVLAFVFKKRYAWVLIMGAAWETAAFVLGALGAHDQQNIGFASGHSLLFLLAPLWINAFVYMTLARMVHYFLPGRRIGPFRPTGMSKWFVLMDILTFIVQGVGGIMANPGSDPSIIKVGLNVYLGGLGCQQFFITCFLGLMISFQWKYSKMDRDGLGRAPAAYGDRNSQRGSAKRRGWKGLLYALYAVLAFISMRIFYRMGEFAGGVTLSNPIPFHEVYSYALDALPMMICLLILAIMHPGRTLVGPESNLPKKTRAEKKAEKTRKREEKEQKKSAKKAAKAKSKYMSGDVELIQSREERGI